MFKHRSGFTLIELLIVVAIIAILAAIAVPNFLEAQVRSKVSRSQTDMRSISVALESYAVDYGKYISNARSFHLLTTPVAYMSSLPDDPFGPIRETDTTGYNNVLAMYGSPIKSMYIYHGTSTYGDSGFAGRYNVHWSLTGLGPDRSWFDPPGGNPYPEYDSSNGSKSRGNVERAGPGYISGNRYRELWNYQ